MILNGGLYLIDEIKARIESELEVKTYIQKLLNSNEDMLVELGQE